MVFIETPLDAAHEAKAFWVEPPEALMLASFKVSVSQVVIVPFVTAFVLSHLTEAHHIPAMASEEPTPCNNHHFGKRRRILALTVQQTAGRETLLPVLSIRLAETIRGPVKRRWRTRRIKPREKLRPRGLSL